MNFLVVGGGGREYSIVEKLAEELAETDTIFCSPGNAGMPFISKNVQNVPIKANEIPKLADFAKENKIGVTIVGPEAPLAEGIVDYFNEQGLGIFGPAQRAAMIETSKVFSYRFMRRHNIPTPDSLITDDPQDAYKYGRDFLRRYGAGVIKADGLTGGKGAIPYFTDAGLRNAVAAMKPFGAAGTRMLVQKFIKGQECSFICWADGEHVAPLISTQDHKPVYDELEERNGLWIPTDIRPNPNTGGMGAYTRPKISRGLEQRIIKEIMIPVVQGMAEEKRKYRGVLYAGLMITEHPDPRKREIYVLEFNARYGDPENQPVMKLLKSGLVAVTFACIDGNLNKIKPEWKDGEACYVVLATKGYPGDYEANKGRVIHGLDAKTLRRMREDDVSFVHAGTEYKQGFFANKDGSVSSRGVGLFVNNGGRVGGINAVGKDLAEARAKAYKWIGPDGVNFDPVMHYRRDIGAGSLAVY